MTGRAGPSTDSAPCLIAWLDNGRPRSIAGPWADSLPGTRRVVQPRIGHLRPEGLPSVTDRRPADRSTCSSDPPPRPPTPTVTRP